LPLFRWQAKNRQEQLQLFNLAWRESCVECVEKSWHLQLSVRDNANAESSRKQQQAKQPQQARQQQRSKLKIATRPPSWLSTKSNTTLLLFKSSTGYGYLMKVHETSLVCKITRALCRMMMRDGEERLDNDSSSN